ncbi:MAG: radical SAM family heme chaperone HemW [Acidobacteriota bacterium]
MRRSPGPCRRRGVGLYVHLPFCVSRCAYCTFITSTDLALMPRVTAAVAREIDLMADREPRPLASLYLGGGTPSLVDAAALGGIFAAVGRSFALKPGAEVTLEANPDDVTEDRIALWRRLGVTRVSIGCQSFSDRILEMLNRRHSAAQSRSAAEAVLAAGLTLSIDLMLGLPLMRREELESTLGETLRLRPQHVSVYLLEMDKPHELARLAERRPDIFPDADVSASQFLQAGRTLVAAGYRHYEVSNFALPGNVARHNTRYWSGLPVLAAGVGAHGQAGRRRWANLAELPAYLEAVARGETPRAWSRRLAEDEALREAVMLGMRQARGVADELLHECGAAAPSFAERLADFLSLGLARRLPGRVRLTPRGWLVSNELLHTLW